jgi:hypothetical protein
MQSLTNDYIKYLEADIVENCLKKIVAHKEIGLYISNLLLLAVKETDVKNREAMIENLKNQLGAITYFYYPNRLDFNSSTYPMIANYIYRLFIALAKK